MHDLEKHKKIFITTVLSFKLLLSINLSENCKQEYVLINRCEQGFWLKKQKMLIIFSWFCCWMDYTLKEVLRIQKIFSSFCFTSFFYNKHFLAKLGFRSVCTNFAINVLVAQMFGLQNAAFIKFWPLLLLIVKRFSVLVVMLVLLLERCSLFFAFSFFWGVSNTQPNYSKGSSSNSSLFWLLSKAFCL